MLVFALLLVGTAAQDGGEPLLSAQAAVPAPRREAAVGTVETFQQVYGNWVLSCDDPGFLGHRIQFDVAIDGQGRIVEGPTLVRPMPDADWRRAAESARLALVRTAPFETPAGFGGGEYRPTFNTSRACARSAEADED